MSSRGKLLVEGSVGNTRRVAERMIVQRASRAHQIAEKLRSIAARLGGYDAKAGFGQTLANDAQELLALADHIERL